MKLEWPQILVLIGMGMNFGFSVAKHRKKMEVTPCFYSAFLIEAVRFCILWLGGFFV